MSIERHIFEDGFVSFAIFDCASSRLRLIFKLVVNVCQAFVAFSLALPLQLLSKELIHFALAFASVPLLHIFLRNDLSMAFEHGLLPRAQLLLLLLVYL